MALVVLLRGVNVGGHRTFRPSLLARELSHLDAVNVGAAGTFVIRRAVSRAHLRAEFARRLPFAAEIMICRGNEIVRLDDLPLLRRPRGPPRHRSLRERAGPASSRGAVNADEPARHRQVASTRARARAEVRGRGVPASDEGHRLSGDVGSGLRGCSHNAQLEHDGHSRQSAGSGKDLNLSDYSSNPRLLIDNLR